MARFKSAMGKVVDMNALAARNEKVRAVGNMKVNARGDSIDSHNRIIRPVTEKVNDSYAKTVGNRSAQPVNNKPAPATVKKDVVLEELTPFEKELEDSSDEDLEIEKIKAKEMKNGK